MKNSRDSRLGSFDSTVIKTKSNHDKPEFLASEALKPRTTTDLDTNPVLSNISVPTAINLSGKNTSAEESESIEQIVVGGVDQASVYSTESRLCSGGVDCDESLTLEKSDDGGINRSPIYKNLRAPNGHPKPLTFSINNDANYKRSSIYESKSTVTAIPIRNPLSNAKSNHWDNEDAFSTRSGSSSMTASLSRSFLFGFYNNETKNRQNTKGIISKEYWMKDDSAKECFACGKRFNTFRRRHHCRICGQIFCSSCTLIISGERFGYDGRMRVCYNCYEHADNYEDSSDDESYADQISHNNDGDRLIFSSQENPSENNVSKEHEYKDGVERDEFPVQQELIFRNNEDAQSILTNSEDTKLFTSTPPPPPKMAIPATRQGESLEISFPSNRNRADSWHNELNRNNGYGTKDRYTIKNVDMITPYGQSFASSNQLNHKGGHKVGRRSLRRTIFNSGGFNRPPMEKTQTGNADSIIGNAGSKNFKFEFNYMKGRRASMGSDMREITPMAEPSELGGYKNRISSPDADTSEDEASMSIYSSLNGGSHSSNPIRSMRTSTKSTQRAEASLQRMKFRRKSKSKPNLYNSESLYKELTSLTNSSPNLVSIVNEDADFAPSSSTTSLATKAKKQTANGGQWRRVSSLSGYLTSVENKNALNEVSNLHLEALLQQVLGDQNFSKAQEWANLLRGFLTKAQNISLNVKDSNTLDFRQNYVKIKRISGGNLKFSKYINGIIFSKEAPCKNMPRMLKNPRILLIMFALEYQRTENHFLSIETVFAQEREYLDKLVSRLTSLSPSVLFVGANVSGYALELLNKAGVVVQFNVKPQVIERIAKLTEADIAISVDKLAANVKMGECEKFELKSFVFGNVCKTYTFLEGCKASLGGTILLRGETPEILRKLKDVSEFMVYVLFSLKLESSLFNDNFLQLSPSYYLKEQERRRNEKVTGYFADFLEKFNSRILTVSPTVEFPIPFLLKRARELGCELQAKRKENEKYAETENIQLNEKTAKVFGFESLALASSLTQKDFRYLIKFIHKKELENLELQFQKRSRQWEVSYAQSRNMLGTGSHQCITVLYSMVSTKTAIPCVGPQLVTIDFFWDSDISIGQFIENLVATASYPCHQGCGGSLRDHYRSYVHGSGKVDVLIEKFQTRLPKLKDIILTWGYCKKCAATSPILQMSEKTWNYSFGKYLEVLFWSKRECVSGIGQCSHDFTKDHVQYFALNDIVARMEYSDLEVHELVTPPRKITWTPYKDIKMKVELYYQILDKINLFYDSVSNRLSRVKLDSMCGDKLVAGQERITELKARLNEEKNIILQDLDKLYRNDPGDEHMSLNIIMKALHDRAVNWDSDFTDFGKNFLPSENDITRITSHQLKKLFSDFGRDIDQIEDDEAKKKSKKQELVESAEKAASLLNNGNDAKSFPQPHIARETHPDAHDLLELTNKQSKGNADFDYALKPINYAVVDAAQEGGGRPGLNRTSSSFNKSFDKGVFSDIQNSAAISGASSPLSNGKGYNANSKVGQLANFFDQMHFDALSKEFELERERERIQLNKNKYQASRVHTSTPIVEIYKNVKDAVDEPLHDLDLASLKNLKSRNHAGKKNSTLKEDGVDNKLENELETSINQWGDEIINKDHTTVEPGVPTPNIVVSSETKEKTTSEPLPPVMTTTNVSKDSSDTPPEKSLLIKALTNFWADRSASLWKPLDYPTSPTEHIFVDSDVIIREDEPSSLISFCLSTSDYKQKMAKLDQQEHIGSTNVDASVNTTTQASDISASENQSNSSLRETTSGSIKHSPPPQMNRQSSHSFQNGKDNLEAVMTKSTGVHLRYQFEDGLTVMSCKIFFAEHFDAFRRICGCNDKFIQSLSRCVKWDSSGGKSGSGFLKTLDDRFVIKQLSHAELDAFIKFTPSYFEYMAQAMFHDLPTTLAKVFGFYQIQVKSSISGAKSYKMDVIIMENLFYERKTTRIFDLKGSMRNRHVEQTGKENEVLLDENMIEYIYESPIHVREYDKKLLKASLWNDTLFLAKMNVMDYSLVVGIDNEGHTLTVGIIDFIRTFTWDKKLENWVKEKGLVGGSGTKKPTVVTPKQYKTRFREAMDRYILMVPDPWYQEST